MGDARRCDNTEATEKDQSAKTAGSVSPDFDPLRLLSNRVTDLRSTRSSLDPKEGSLPDPMQAAERLSELGPDERLKYAKALIGKTSGKSQRFEGAAETIKDPDGKEKEILVDFDIVDESKDGRIKRKDLFDTTRGASCKADELQKVYDTVNPAATELERARRTYQKGSLISDPGESPLSSIARIGLAEIQNAQGVETQVDRELEARGFSEDFRKNARAALRDTSGQHVLEMDAIERELKDRGASPNMTAEEKSAIEHLKQLKSETLSEQESWKKMQSGIKLLR